MHTELLNTLALTLAGCINLAAISATVVILTLKELQQKQKEQK
jgi:hypothetical protein